MMTSELKRQYKVGDMVRIPSEDGRRGRIADIRTGEWEDRGGNWHSDPWYKVPSPKPGSPVEWYLGDWLEYISDRVSGEIIGL